MGEMRICTQYLQYKILSFGLELISEIRIMGNPVKS